MTDFPYGTDYPDAPGIDRDGTLLTDDDPYQDVPPPDEPPHEDGRSTKSDRQTTWEPVDLGPWLRGEVERPEPAVGITRSDGLRLIYPGREHAVLGETESGKSWFAIGCAAVELAADNNVVYVHYEESDPGSTVERLRLVGVTDDMMSSNLRFVAPVQPVRAEWLAPLLFPAPVLVIHDGVNEGMAMHTAGQDVDGWSSFRRRLILPCLQVGAAVLSCDHVPMSRDGTRRDAYGTVHKGNTLDGARFALENTAPMGRGLRGVSYMFVTKDRPGYLRARGKPSKTPGKTFIGTLVVDETTADFVALYAPKVDEETPESDPASKLKDIIHSTIAESPVSSKRLLLAALRNAGHNFKTKSVLEALDDLVAAGLLAEVPGKRNAVGLKAVVTVSQQSAESTVSRDRFPSPFPFREGNGETVSDGSVSESPETVGNGGKRSTTGEGR